MVNYVCVCVKKRKEKEKQEIKSCWSSQSQNKIKKDRNSACNHGYEIGQQGYIHKLIAVYITKSVSCSHFKTGPIREEEDCFPSHSWLHFKFQTTAFISTIHILSNPTWYNIWGQINSNTRHLYNRNASISSMHVSWGQK